MSKIIDHVKIGWIVDFKKIGSSYGNTGCRVFKWGVQDWKYFCLKINIPKGNYRILRIGVVRMCQKVPI